MKKKNIPFQLKLSYKFTRHNHFIRDRRRIIPFASNFNSKKTNNK